jgi:lantibiotic modifying enzyme
MSLMATGYGLKNELIDIQQKLQTPGLPPEQIAALKQKYDKGLSKFETLDRLIMAEKTPDQAKIVQAARQSYNDNPALSTKYSDFDKYLTDFEKNVTKARGVFQDDIVKLKAATADKEISDAKSKVDPNYDQTETTASAIIKAKAAPALAASIAAGFNQRTAKGDFAGALNYLTDHAKQLSDEKREASPKATETTPKVLPPPALKDIAAARRAEVAQQRVKDAEKGAAKRIEDTELLKQKAKNFRDANNVLFTK